MQSLAEQSVIHSLDQTHRTSDRQRLLRKLWEIRRREQVDLKETESPDRQTVDN
jgi:hypothetical protein